MESAPVDSLDTIDTAPSTESYALTVRVMVDGVATEGVTVMQGGGHEAWTTGADGTVAVTIDPAIAGDHYVVAGHPECRNGGTELDGPTSEIVEVELDRFDPSDNVDYTFRDPGDAPGEMNTSAQCSHCHLSIHEAWWSSPHRTAAKNPTVHDVYQGMAVGVAQADCGGTWSTVSEPGSGAQVSACVVAASVASTGSSGGCADCHAPGIDGELGGRDLLDATDFAYEYGVHCDVCHRVESVHQGEAAGVAGWLRLLRPSEPSASPAFGDWAPLTFGPYLDVLNPNMGSAWREEFHEAAFCGGCHQLEQGPLAGTIDLARWPSGGIPIHSTFEEWSEGPMNPSAPCQSCHMPPLSEVGNSSDLYTEIDAIPGVAAGWERPPGDVRQHAWWGPRQPEGGMLGLAAWVDIEKEVDAGVLTARVTVKNTGPGHAIPTGEPMRNLVLAVEATCEGAALDFAGGDVVPSFGGSLGCTDSVAEPLDLPAASVGMTVRFFARDGDYDYTGHGPFGDGQFSVAEKGLPRWRWLDDGVVASVDASGVRVARGVPEGSERAVLIADSFPADGATADPLMGLPGFAFARVLVDANGNEMVPHHLAVDVQSDNRILPSQSFTTEHQFVATCDVPEVHAILVHRAYPWSVAQSYGWTLTDSVMDEARR